jgi:hypothetical protein
MLEHEQRPFVGEEPCAEEREHAGDRDKLATAIS